MNKCLKIARWVRSSNFSIASLSTLNVILLALMFAGSCKKEITFPKDSSTLSIEKAKQFFASITQANPNYITSLRTDSTETESNDPLIIPDWVNAELYEDEFRHVSVVEVPILASHLAKIQIIAENSVVDSTTIDETVQVNRLVFTQTANGAISFAIMKLNGTPNYLASHATRNNSFKNMDAAFEGRLGYYDLKDSLLKGYLVQSGHFYQALSPSDTGNVTSVQDRWGFCILYYIDVPCTGHHHTWEQRDQCLCGTRIDCIPPRRIAVMVECSGPSEWFGETTDHTVVVPPPPPNSPWHSGSGGSGTQNDVSCFVSAVNDFDEKYNVHLLDDFEEIALGCSENIDCSTDETAFEDCVVDEISDAYFNSPPIPLLPLSFPEDLDNCFLSQADCPNCTYTATLYIEQPVPGQRTLYNPSRSGSSGKNSGHTFLGIDQYDGIAIYPIRSKTFGFYPVDKPTGQEQVPGSFYEENGNTLANISVTYSLSFSQYESIKQDLSSYNNIYQVQYLNCSTIPVAVLGNAGFNIPTTPRDALIYGEVDVNPADLGEDLRSNHPAGIFNSSPAYFTPPLSKCH